MTREHKATIAQPNKDSARSKKRENRNFISLEKSSRKHKRALRRSLVSRTQYGKLYEAGAKVNDGGDTFMHNAGGSIDFHS
jgi:hypothetical protein